MKIMSASGKLLAVLCAAASLLSCASSPPPPQETPGEEPAAAVAQPAAPPEQSAQPQADFVVTEDLYKKTFAEIEALISRLNDIIKEKNYDEWVGYLSSDYIAKTSSRDFLNQASESPILKRDRITLGSLKDYFLDVVVPSRIQAKLDDLAFIDETHVKAITVINGNRVILYLLERVDSRWMIGIW